MIKASKHYGPQMKLPGAAEWGLGGLLINGKDVFRTGNRRVSNKWLSRCEEERALTQGMMEKIADLSNLEAALRRVVSNKGSCGIDGMTTTELKYWFAKRWRWLQSTLLNGQYTPCPIRRVEIPKPNGGTRILGIPTAKDRLVQQAISQVMTRQYDPTFSRSSHGFRPGKSAHSALREAGEYVASGKTWVVDIDLEKFFDTVNHDRLRWLLSSRIGDKRVLTLISKFLKAGMFEGGLTSQRVKGTPQGSPLSPLLSNIILDELDKELEKRGHCFVRYADDMIIMSSSEQASERVYLRTVRFIEERLKLKVNRDKSRICSPYELNFLGHTILKDGSLGLSKASEARFKAKLKEVTRRNRGISLEQLITELNRIIRGWVQYFKMARMVGRLRVLESWLKRKIRCFRIRQCKRALGIARFLHRLGVPWKRCWSTAGSSHGWFRLSITPAAHEAMNNKWFTAIGLINLKDYYLFNFKETAQYERRTLGGVRGRQS